MQESYSLFMIRVKITQDILLKFSTKPFKCD